MLLFHLSQIHGQVVSDLTPENWSRIDVGSWARKGEEMAKRTPPEETINKLREAEVVIAAGRTVADPAKAALCPCYPSY